MYLPAASQYNHGKQIVLAESELALALHHGHELAFARCSPVCAYRLCLLPVCSGGGIDKISERMQLLALAFPVSTEQQGLARA